MSPIEFKNELNNNNLSSTFEAEIDGIRHIVKCIDISKMPEADAEKIKRNLDVQIKFSSALEGEEYRSNIALFTSSCKQGDKLCYMRPFIDGEPLANIIRENKYLAQDEASTIILKVARLLTYAHQRGIIHGDLKPENIIIASDGTVSIIDWETMKLNKEAQDLYADGRTLKPQELIGTPHYMAPEQCSGEVSEQADVYALGMIYYKMLTGETPFDQYDILGIYDAKHRDLDEIIYHDKLHEDRKVNENIIQIISSALKVDLNDRTLSAAQFVNEIENYLNITSSIPVHPMEKTSTEVVPCVHKSMNGQEYKLVLIGHPGAGKTVLAAGLYAMNNAKFSVEGTSEETIRFMDGVKTILQRKEWPEPTARSGVKKLDFKVFYNNHSDCITFDEYAGENVLSANYFKDFFTPSPAGAIILLNPSFIDAVDDLTQNKQISSLKNCISFLSELDNPPPIAFVITAADRLETDLKDRVSEFEGYVNAIKNSLKSKKIIFKIFYVSVSGKLNADDKNQKAALNPSNVQKPFVWILDQIHHKKTSSLLKKIVCLSAIILAVLVLILAGRWCWEWYSNNELQDRFTKFNAMYSGKIKPDDLSNYITDLAKLRSEWCTKGHILTEKNVGSQVGECDNSCIEWSKRFIFPDRKKAFKATLLQIEEKIDEVKGCALQTEFEALKERVSKKEFQGACSDFESNFKEWTPLSDKGAKLKEKQREENISKIPAMKERHSFLVIDKKLSAVVSEKKNEYPTDLDDEIAKLPKKDQTKLEPAEWEQLHQQVENQRQKAHESVERVNFAEIAKRLTDVINDNDCKIFPSDIDTRIAHLPMPSYLPSADRTQLDNNQAHLRNQARRCIAIRIANDVKTVLHGVIADPSKDIPAEYQKKYQEWRDCKGYFTIPNEFEKIEKEITDLLNRARKCVAIHIADEIKTMLNAVIKDPSKDIPEGYQHKYQEWCDHKGYFVDSKDAEKIDKEISDLLNEAYEKIFYYTCANLRNEIVSFNGNTDELADLIQQKYIEFFKANGYHVKDELFEEQKHLTLEKLQRRLERYISDLCLKFDEEQMREKNECTPEFKDGIEKDVLPLIPEIKEPLQSLLTDKLAETKNKWLKVRQDKVDEFKRDNESANARDALYRIKKFVMEESGNPFLKQAEDFVLNKIHSDVQNFLSKVNTRSFSDDDFLYIKRLAEEANGNIIKEKNFCVTLKNAPIRSWLNKYLAWKNQNTNFTVTPGTLSVLVSYSNPDDPYFRNFSCTGLTESYSSKGVSTTITRFKNNVFVPFKGKEWSPTAKDMTIGQKWEFSGEIFDENGIRSDIKIAEVNIAFFPGVDEISSCIEGNGDHGVIVRIDIDVSGEPFLRWLKNNPFPEGK